MATSKATAQWNGSLEEGSGTTTLTTSDVATFEVTWKARTEPGQGVTNPEELLAAAHAACFSMALSDELSNAGYVAERVTSTASVSFTAGTGITGIALTTRAKVADIDAQDFAKAAEATKSGCPVSAALSAVPISLDAALE